MIADEPAVLDNGRIAELLARAADSAEPRSHRQVALRRAARAAMLWPEEAAHLASAGGKLTDLPAVGPWVAGLITEWLSSPTLPQQSEPPETRRGFLTRARARAALSACDPEHRPRILGDLQMHTTETDGRASLGVMVSTCLDDLGYEYIAITDHSKGLRITNGMDEERLARQGEAINAVNAALAATGRTQRVLRSIEMNLDPEGNGDMDEEALRSLDLVLGAFHSHLRVVEDQTERYLRAVRNPMVNILAHPRGRRWDERPGLVADWPAVFAEAAAHGTAVEVDCYADRQDLQIELLRQAAQTDVVISISTDSHHPQDLAFMELGIAAAVIAGFPQERIVNTMPVEPLLEWARAKRL
jgi:putative hydrolase